MFVPFVRIIFYIHIFATIFRVIVKQKILISRNIFMYLILKLIKNYENILRENKSNYDFLLGFGNICSSNISIFRIRFWNIK